MSKVLVIFPQFNPLSPTHYPYWYQLFNQAGKHLDISLLFESGTTPPAATFNHLSQVQVQSINHQPFNLIQRQRLIRRLFSSGYTNIFIHYSYWSVFLSRLFTPAQIFFWDCEYYSQKPHNPQLSLALKTCHTLVTGSQTIAKQYQQVFTLPHLRTGIVPNWVKPISVKPARLKPSPLHLLFVHHLSPRKGTRELPLIIKHTVSSIPHLHLHLIGNGPDKEYLISRFKQLNLSHQVTFHGRLSRRQVFAYYQACDCFIMPSRSEGFPRVILEAMINQLPLVSTKVGNVAEIAGSAQQQYLVPPANPQLFAQKIVNLVNSGSKQQLIRQNYAQALKYNLTSSTRAFVDLFS